MSEHKTRIFSLLVGVSSYPDSRLNLVAPQYDIADIQDFLDTRYKDYLADTHVLLNEQATRSGVLDAFEAITNEIRTEDIFYFHYCGHGSTQKADPAFRAYDNTGEDQTLVLYDSRTYGQYDLADKELAVLLSKISAPGAVGPHVVLAIDSCHSGSISRSVEDFSQMIPRHTPGKHESRSLHTYFEDFYNTQQTLQIPRSKHILLSACRPDELAYERKSTRRGIFSQYFLEALKRDSNISYADLYEQCIRGIRGITSRQNPQFETNGYFNGNTRFFGNEISPKSRTYEIFFDKEENAWAVDGGAVNRFPITYSGKVELVAYADANRKQVVGNTHTTAVGLNKSIVEDRVDFLKKASKKVTFYADLLSIPSAPTPIFVQLEALDKESLNSVYDKHHKDLNLFWVSSPKQAEYGIISQDGSIQLRQMKTDQLIGGATGNVAAGMDHLLQLLGRIQKWQTSLDLNNPDTQLKPDLVDFQFSLIQEDGNDFPFVDNKGKSLSRFILDLQKEGDQWKNLYVRVRARNMRSPYSNPLNIVMLYISSDFGVYPLYRGRLAPGQDYVTMYGEGRGEFLNLPGDATQATETMKLIVSENDIITSELEQDDIELGQIISFSFRGDQDMGIRGLGGVNIGRRPYDWFAKTITYTLNKQEAQLLAGQKVSISGSKVSISAGNDTEANISLASAKLQSKTDEISLLPELLAQATLLNLTSTQGPELNVIELSDIHSGEHLSREPIQINLELDNLGENETILPLSMEDGILLPYVSERTDNGTRISVDYLPEQSDEERPRSLGKALKMAFFKIALKTDTMKLSWLSFDGEEAVYNKEGLPEKVAGASRILLLIHGIVGETDDMAPGMFHIKDATGKPLSDLEHYDLILTFDYENLYTPIEETARKLKQLLNNIGIDKNDNKELTIIAHSLGGLLARWMIEREWGYMFVDHLIMAGTPNLGSAYAKSTDYLGLMIQGLNFLKKFWSHAGIISTVLNYGQDLTYTLSQLKHNSPFITDLNASEAPPTPYSLIIGDIQNYDIEGGNLLQRIHQHSMKRLGMFIYDGPNDIAISLESGIYAGEADKMRKHTIHQVACHHHNYFTSEAGTKAIEEALKQHVSPVDSSQS